MLFIFLINFIIVNWSDISWIFNFTFLERGISGIFESRDVAAVDARRNTISPAPTPLYKKNSTSTDKENSIEIPKLQIEAPIVMGQEYKNNLDKALDQGVMLYPDSVFPGEKGRFIILGHSAPPGWPKIKYDWIFTRLNELENGDEIIINFNHLRFSYKVKGKTVLEKGGDIPAEAAILSESVLYLLTCWPPGQNIKRLAIEAT